MKDQPHHDFLALQNLRLSICYTINTLASKHCIFSVTKKNATNFRMSVSEKKINNVIENTIKCIKLNINFWKKT